MRLFWGSLFWVLGILLCAILDLSEAFCIVTLAGCFVLAVLLRGQRRAAAICFAILTAGSLRYAIHPSGPATSDIANLNGTHRATVEGIVCEEPDRRSTHSQLTISVERVRVGNEWLEAEGKALLSSPIYPRFEYGDRLSIEGGIEEPPKDNEFSYKQYLADKGIYSILSGDAALLEAKPSLYRWLLRVKQGLRSTIERLLPDPESGLLVGVILGLDHTLPDYMQQAYQNTGLSHIIVISGFNISLVAQALMAASQRMGKKLGLWLALVGILVFALFVGWSPPVTRAAIMGALTIVASITGRKPHTLTSLAAATLIMSLISPRILWSVSFQLSLAASAGLILVEPAIANRLALQGSMQSPVRDIVVSTFVAQLVTLPIAWYHFGELSIVALPANMLVLWAQPAILILGAIAAGLGMLWLPLGQIGAALVWPLLRYTNVVVRILGGLDQAMFQLPRAELWMVWAIYALLALFARLSPHKRQDSGDPESQNSAPRWIIPAVMITTMLIAATLRLPDGDTHIYFFDIGQGDSALIVSPGGRSILIDGGADPSLLAARIGETLPFWQRSIDCVVATHADGDHLTGLVPLAERYHFSLAIESPLMADSPLVTRWHQAIENQGIDIIKARAEQKVEVGDGLTMSVLHPDLRNPSPNLDENRYSVVTMLDAGVRILFTADMDTIAENYLLSKSAAIDADILKVAHHGAGSATSPTFVEAVSPELAIISVGEDNRYGHPAQSCLDALYEAGTAILRTDQDGTIEIVIP